MAVKSRNDALGSEGIVSSVLVLGEYLPIRAPKICIQAGAKISEEARKEMSC